MKVGDLVRWHAGQYDAPGLILELRPAKKLNIPEASLSSAGMAVLAMIPELSNDPEWFHERELEAIL